MQWWNDFVAWFYSDAGQQVFVSAIIPFVAIVLGAVIAALIGRGAVKRLVNQRDHETRSSAVASLISAGQSAVRWHSLTPAAREHQERLAADADVRVRLLPLSASNVAADWAAHQLTDMRVNSVSFSFQAEQTLAEYRERLVLWLHKPNKARKLFAADLERWRYEDQAVDPLVVEQQKWAEEQFTAATDQPVEHAPDVKVPDVVIPPAATAPAAEPTPAASPEPKVVVAETVTPDPVTAESATPEPVVSKPVVTSPFVNPYTRPLATPLATTDAADDDAIDDTDKK